MRRSFLPYAESLLARTGWQFLLRVSLIIFLFLLPPLMAPDGRGQILEANGIMNAGFENLGEAWQEFGFYQGGEVSIGDTSAAYSGTRSARLHAPVRAQSGAECAEGSNAVRAGVGQYVTSPAAYLGNLGDASDSFSAWWYVLGAEGAVSVYSVRAGVILSGEYTVEYYYGVADRTNRSREIFYNLGPIPVISEWFQTKRNLRADLQPLNIIDQSVRVLHVWFAALGNCTTQGETAWVDDSSLMFVLNPPIALFTVSVSIGPAPLAVVFDASESYATSQGASIVRYSWNADGTSGSGIRWSHNFTSAGEHLVTLTVVDSNGQTASATQTISVTPRDTALLTPFLYISGGLILTSVFFLALFRRRFSSRTMQLGRNRRVRK